MAGDLIVGSDSELRKRWDEFLVSGMSDGLEMLTDDGIDMVFTVEGGGGGRVYIAASCLARSLEPEDQLPVSGAMGYLRRLSAGKYRQEWPSWRRCGWRR